MSTLALQQRATRFLRWLHDDQAGYIEIVAGTTDPDRPTKIHLLMGTRKWFYLDPERPDLYAAAGDYAAQLAADYGNVYTGIRTYRSKKRAEENVKPGRVIFIDDAPAAPERPYSASIRTSAHSRHAYYKCAQNVTKDDARRAAAALGGDPSGVDLTQLVRFPGTSNTKNGGCWSVEPESTPGTIYNLDELRSAWPAVECSPKGEITPLAMPAVEKHLSNIDDLLTCNRTQLIKPTTQTGRILGGEMLTFAAKGKMDDSRSMNACAVGLGLLLRGFMDDEIAAIVFHLYRKWEMERDKGTEWCKADIARILAYAHTQHPEAKQSPTRYRQQANGITIVSRPAASRARADRPTKFDPPMLFARYQAEPTLCAERRKARASALGISTATLDRLEDGLEAIGLIEIEARPGMPGRVILLGGVINIPQPEVLSAPIEAPPLEAPIERAVSGENADRSLQCKGETHPPLDAPSLPAAPPAWCSRPELAEWVTDAFDCYPGRASIRKVIKHVEMQADGRRFNLATLKRLYDDERTRRAYARQDAKEIAKARAMRWSSLIKKSQALASAAAQMRREKNKRAPVWERMAGIYAAEEARRYGTGEAPTRLLRGRGVDADQVLILAEIDEQRRQQSAQQQGPQGRVCSPPTAPAVLQPDLFADAPAQSPYHVGYFSEMYTRLKARQQVQP